MLLSRTSRYAEKLLCDLVEWEIEDSAADPRAGCDPILTSAVIKDDRGRRDLTEEELAAIEEHCSDALTEMGSNAMPNKRVGLAPPSMIGDYYGYQDC